MSSSKYIERERKTYALYTLSSRAIPFASDGLKAAARRVLWTARDGKKYKSASLAGATMPIHPHSPPEGAIDTLAAPYGNNIPLLSGDGAFGTLLNPTAYGASRYTSVKISEFCKDVVFKDIEIIPLQENYDGTLEEPKHFLPLIPVVLLNPQEGIAVGFASNILPRTLETIVKSQIDYLEGRKIKDELPAFGPTSQFATEMTQDKVGRERYTFIGSFKRTNSSAVEITNLPYGTVHEKYIEFLMAQEENGVIQEYEDNSKDQYSITVRFKKGTLSKMSEEDIINCLNLKTSITENLTIIDFDGERVIKVTYSELIAKFCDWRLGWYVQRYQRLAELIGIDIQKYKDILLAIQKNVGGLAKKISSRSELKDFLKEIGVVHIDYIADLPIYRFTEDERKKVEQKLKDASDQLSEYQQLLKSEEKRRIIYTSELKTILKKKGDYYVSP